MDTRVTGRTIVKILFMMHVTAHGEERSDVFKEETWNWKLSSKAGSPLSTYSPEHHVTISKKFTIIPYPNRGNFIKMDLYLTDFLEILSLEDKFPAVALVTNNEMLSVEW
jgi:hypothetical protein